MKTLQDDNKKLNIQQQSCSDIDINQLLKGDKKIVAFVGTSKSGTSFILNNIANLLANRGVNVAILDATKIRSSYYIYTKNQENLRNIALTSIQDLTHGTANGVNTKQNLTVYTALPGENDFLPKVEPILETLLKKHSLILIDCDFYTPINYFDYATEIYVVQTMDVLTIQPLTEFLSELKNKGISLDSKIRIVLNKFVELTGVTEKELIWGMAFYNDPTMTYMKELFNRNLVKYITIPFEKEIYEKYLQSIVNCDINLNGYSNSFLNILENIGNEIYPFVNSNEIKENIE